MFNNVGPSGLILIAIVILVLFGRGKVASLMGEVGNGISSFRRGVKEGTEDVEFGPKSLAAERPRDVAPENDNA